MAKIGLNSNNKANKKVAEKVDAKLTKKPQPIFKKWNIDNVKKDIEKQIEIIKAGRNNYITISKLAANYKLTARNFRQKCLDDDDLANLLEIYNGIYIEHIMTEAIKSGKINTQTEDYLKNEMNAFVGSGHEQNIKWILDGAEVKNIIGEPIDIQPEKSNLPEHNPEKDEIMFEVNNENNKE